MDCCSCDSNSACSTFTTKREKLIVATDKYEKVYLEKWVGTTEEAVEAKEGHKEVKDMEDSLARRRRKVQDPLSSSFNPMVSGDNNR